MCTIRNVFHFHSHQYSWHRQNNREIWFENRNLNFISSNVFCPMMQFWNNSNAMSCVIRRDNEEQMLMYNWISSVTSSLDLEITSSLFNSPPFVILIGNIMLQEKFNLFKIKTLKLYDLYSNIQFLLKSEYWNYTTKNIEKYTCTVWITKIICSFSFFTMGTIVKNINYITSL